MAKKKKKLKKLKKTTPTTTSRLDWEERKPILKFAGSFLLICLVFFLITNMAWFSSFRAPILNMYSIISAALLNIFGYGVKASGEILTSQVFSVSIEEGCDAIAPAILYSVSVAIFPVVWQARLKGILYGLAAIIVLNIIRIITLYLTGVHVPSLFDFMHVEFWQAIFIVFTVGIWIYWMKWATQHHASTISVKSK